DDAAGDVVVGMDQAAHGLVDDEGGGRQDGGGVGLGGQDGRAVPAERAGPRGPAAGEAHGDQRQGDGADVGQVVAGVGQQAQRAGGEAGDHLSDDDPQVQSEGDAEAILSAHSLQGIYRVAVYNEIAYEVSDGVLTLTLDR